MSYKFTGYLLLLGLGLAGLSALLHPITINPWDGSAELHKAAKADLWIIDHVMMAISIFLWLIGMAMAVLLICKNKVVSIITTLLLMVALTIWLIILGMELTIFPAIFNRLSDESHQTVGALFFGYGLFSGYLAMVLIWIGNLLLSFAIKNTYFYTIRFFTFGIISSTIGVFGTIATILVPNLFLLLVSTLFPTLWIVLLALKLVKNHNGGLHES